MSKTPQFDQIVREQNETAELGEWSCKLTGETWQVTQKDIDRYKRFNVPPLAVKPQVFFRQLLSLHTGYSWWWNTDEATGKPILTYMHPARPFKVMNDAEWRKQDFTDRGRDVDLERSFFDQLLDLLKTVPLSAWKNIEQPINSIVRISLGDENSYFNAGTSSKDSLYCTDSFNLERCVEVAWSSNVTDAYNVERCQNMNRCIVARESRNCVDCQFVFDVRDCESCFMTWNQRHRRYMWRNEQLSEGEWKKRREELDLGSAKTFNALYQEFKHALARETVWPENFNIKSQNCTGEYLINCVDVENGWYSEGARDGWWSVWGNMGTEGVGLGIDIGGSGGWGNGAAVNSSNCRFGWFVTRCQNVEYSIECEDLEDCFGCIGIRRKRFCIFNKQYTEEDYYKTLDTLKTAMVKRGEYGEYFPSTFAQTPFRHSASDITFRTPEAMQKQLNVWDPHPDSDGAFGNWEGRELATVDELPDRITEVGDEWTKKGIMDPGLKRPYGILKPELQFYRRMNLPVRREHFVKRIEDLWAELNQMSLLDRTCQACNKPIQVPDNRTYPDRKVYCQSCYLEYLETRS